MSGVYKAVQVDMLTTGYSWATRPLVAYLVGGTYTPLFAVDTTIANIPSGALLAGPVTVTPSLLGGTATALNLDFGVITTTVPIVAVVIADTGSGSGAAATLVLYIDQGIGFGQIVNGLDTQIIWDVRGVWAP